MGVFGVKGKLKGRPKERKQGVEKMERDWDDRGQLTLLMAFQFCVFPPGHSPNTRWKRCAPLCTAVYRCVCARALVTHAKSLPIPGGELLLPWTTSIPYESHKHHYFQERCQWQLCWLTLVVYTRAPARTHARTPHSSSCCNSGLVACGCRTGC